MLGTYQLLNSFSSINLEELDEKKLMNRTDTKYVFPESQLLFFLEQLKEDYRVLDVDGVRISRYESLYFDTEKFDLFHKHHRGKANRHKIRFRKYVESNLNFFEIKFKNNCGRTIKKRVEQSMNVQTISNDAEAFLHHHTEIRSAELLPQFWSDFSRITLANCTLPERVTLDMNLKFRKNEKKYTINDLVIAEVKQEKFITSAFLKLMKKHHVREGSVSKYCLGVIKINDEIKHNNFKPKLRNINKVIYGASSGT